MGSLVRRAEQPARNDLGLDFGRTLEDAENAGIAENARDREFKRKAVSAMDLDRVVGVGPSHPRGEELRHARLQIAALAGILLPGRKIGKLPRDHDLSAIMASLASA